LIDVHVEQTEASLIWIGELAESSLVYVQRMNEWMEIYEEVKEGREFLKKFDPEMRNAT
jgi:hypothetical protein